MMKNASIRPVYESTGTTCKISNVKFEVDSAPVKNVKVPEKNENSLQRMPILHGVSRLYDLSNLKRKANPHEMAKNKSYEVADSARKAEGNCMDWTYFNLCKFVGESCNGVKDQQIFDFADTPKGFTVLVHGHHQGRDKKNENQEAQDWFGDWSKEREKGQTDQNGEKSAGAVSSLTFALLSKGNGKSAHGITIRPDGTQTTAVVESGASHHMTGDLSCFQIVFWDDPVTLTVADRTLDTPAYRGYFQHNSLGLMGGLYHPDEKLFLVSVSLLNDENDCRVVFEGRDALYLQKKKTGFKIPMRRDTLTNLPQIDFAFHSLSELDTAGDLQNGKSRAAWSEPAFVNLTRADRLRQHERFGHFHIDGLEYGRCPLCDLAKSRQEGCKSERPEHCKPKAWLDQVDWDHTYGYPLGLDGEKFLLSGVETFHGWVENYPHREKDEAWKGLREWCLEVGKPKRVRSDNDPTFRGEKSDWRKSCLKQSPPIEPTTSAPFTPQRNGVVERWNQTSKNALRANMIGVDPRLWPYCSKYIAWTWNRLARKEQKSPFEKVHDRAPSLKYFKKFGVLCYARKHVTKSTDLGALDVRYERGVFLGYSKNSCYLVGVWRDDKRTKVGLKFTVIENRSCKFDESCTIADIDDLREKNRGTFVPFAAPDKLCASNMPDPLVAPSGSHEPDQDAPRDQGDSGPNGATGDQQVEEGGKAVEGGKEESAAQAEEEVVTPEAEELDEPPARPKPKVVKKKRKQKPKPAVVVNNKKGRPKGSKNKPGSKKPGPKPKAAEAGNVFQLPDDFDFGRDLDEYHAKRIEEEGEEVFAHVVSLTRAQILRDPDAPKYIEADDVERLRLLAKECWTVDEKPQKGDEVVPSCVIYTKKRCGTYKARLVALGNLQSKELCGEIYSPTISHAASRALLVDAAANGKRIKFFDISNAFICASLGDERVFVRLPKHWSTDPRGDVVRLLKSLYGLRISPRRWFDTYRKTLEELGWKMCEREPGLFRKGVLTLSVYVDDCVMSGDTEEILGKEMGKILDKFPGKVIPPKAKPGEKGCEVYDLLGATLEYNASKKTMRIHMAEAIDRVLKKFNMVDCRGVATPVLPGRQLPEIQTTEVDTSAPETSFPLRSLVGSLQYIACMCRVDIVYAVQRVAREVVNPTPQAVKAAKRILAYLKATREIGLEYPPKQIAGFAGSGTAVCPICHRVG
ncbi:unnamed protein product [Amoebophrya sp. A120]|nr:unnamed protein product [Amoebophrya sp. A120]|eukprot:GSA120T00010591001.1